MMRAETTDHPDMVVVHHETRGFGAHVVPVDGVDFVCNDANSVQVGTAQVGENGDPVGTVLILRNPHVMRHGMGLVATMSADELRHFAAAAIGIADELEAQAAQLAAAAIAKARGQ